jgi:hypothetical protein
MSGGQLAHALFKYDRYPNFLSTGFRETFTPGKIKAMGMRGLAMKPLMKRELAKIIRQVVDGETG